VEAPRQEAVLRLPILIQVSPARPLAGPMGESGCRRPYRRMLQWSMQPPLRSRVLAGLPIAWCRRGRFNSVRQIKLDRRFLNGFTEAGKRRAQGVAGADQSDQGRSIVVEQNPLIAVASFPTKRTYVFENSRCT
jgi:hypothetical protein